MASTGECAVIHGFLAGRLVRRILLAGLIAGCAALEVRQVGAAPQSGPASEAGEEAEVEKLSRKAGLTPFGQSRTEHFLALGDAPEGFRRAALKHCEALGQDFLGHFQGKGFDLAFPPRRLTVVVLKDQASYGALLGEAPGKDVGGHYDLETNRLVIFDFRPGKEGPAAAAERLNLFTLVHETAHQLSFNMGLFDRKNPPPLCLSEGLATYVELWRPGIKNSIGGINRPRLKALREAQDWIPTADLLNGDRAFEGESEQLAYAESWLLVHHFLRSSARLPRWRDYLATIRAGTKPLDGLETAEKALGPLAKLDRELKEEARKYFRD
jgi:hypothetical protein